MPTPVLAYAGQRTREIPLQATDASVVVAEFLINNHQSFRAEIIERGGKRIVSLSRWKVTPAGPRRTGQTFEFAGHRTEAVEILLGEVQRVLHVLENQGACS